mmetsp:Transcript_28777/g.28485  ORF Transcript_28777/g.28485 Transcript_28777/m.28485 type:complete len:105 (+) Transcript_28777:61-375(+)
MAELYKLFKTIDDTNDGVISYKEIAIFIEEMYTKDNFTYSADDISQVHAKFNDVHSADTGDYTDFDTFVSAFEKWFIVTGAVKFSDTRNQKNAETDETWFTEEQ